jgi:hypothetical protein
MRTDELRAEVVKRTRVPNGGGEPALETRSPRADIAPREALELGGTAECASGALEELGEVTPRNALAATPQRSLIEGKSGDERFERDSRAPECIEDLNADTASDFCHLVLPHPHCGESSPHCRRRKRARWTPEGIAVGERI